MKPAFIFLYLPLQIASIGHIDANAAPISKMGLYSYFVIYANFNAFNLVQFDQFQFFSTFGFIIEQVHKENK